MYVIRFPSRSKISDRCGRSEALSDSVVNLSAVFRTKIPVTATTGSTIAAASTPPSADSRSTRPTALVLVTVQSKSCTGLSVRGQPWYYDRHPQYYRHNPQTTSHTLPLSSR
jgi:hypothetical protein